MLIGALSGDDVRYSWRDASAISPYLLKAVIGAEDEKFCRHHGFDWQSIDQAIQSHERHPKKRLRGASTLSQQAARSLFLVPWRSWVRKGIEAYFTVLIETTWPKRRILEVYANIAELEAPVDEHDLQAEDAIGEIVNRSGGPTFEGYYNNDEANAARYDHLARRGDEEAAVTFLRGMAGDGPRQVARRRNRGVVGRAEGRILAGELDVAGAGRAVRIGSGPQAPMERPRRADADRHVAPPHHAQDLAGVARHVVDLDVACHAGDAAKVQLGGGGGDQERHHVVDPGVDVQDDRARLGGR